jgi:hypothetical protein
VTEGTANLIDAAREAGTERIIVMGLAHASQPGEVLADERSRCSTTRRAKFAPALATLVELARLTIRVGASAAIRPPLRSPASACAADGALASTQRTERRRELQIGDTHV